MQVEALDQEEPLEQEIATHILESRDITLPTKVHLVKNMVFRVIMYGCELDYKES